MVQLVVCSRDEVPGRQEEMTREVLIHGHVCAD
jgi:hypothetical protein